MSISNFGRDIKALRTKRKIGSRELARLIGKAETYISQLERGLIKKPDYDIAYAIMEHLGWEEENIEDFLYDFYHIKSPERIEAEAEEVENWEEQRALEIEEMWVQRQEELVSDTDNQESKLTHTRKNFESKWMVDLREQLERKNREIKEEFSFNIDKNIQTFENVINNLHSLLTSMREDRENFNFFIGLFENDLTNLGQESKDKILKAVKEEINKHNQNNTQV
ncbi:helix-turn-helix domain-containing protein [Bacillus toyonensis]|uniref:helix-turn-helix domain-containing protein n=1 Tax=Bacillus toyonensis TaxID=155322 RepID=UPI00259E827C|nr:helix-turn-helix transcriptional regulator [Bacillus toyonensis]MDM5257060.1 helix-turn-helix transcriptional regulator [Bacillus toyonensis]